MSENKNVWVFIEQDEGRIADVSLELIAKGRELADRLESELGAVLCGMGVEAPRDGPRSSGAPTASFSPSTRSSGSTGPCPTRKVLTRLVRENAPYILLFGASPVGRDLGPRVASAIRSGLTADCTDLQIGDFDSKKDGVVYKDLLLQIRPAFGGNLIATIVNPRHRPQMATVREGVMRMNEPQARAEGQGRASEPAPSSPRISPSRS